MQPDGKCSWEAIRTSLNYFLKTTDTGGCNWRVWPVTWKLRWPCAISGCSLSGDPGSRPHSHVTGSCSCLAERRAVPCRKRPRVGLQTLSSLFHAAELPVSGGSKWQPITSLQSAHEGQRAPSGPSTHQGGLLTRDVGMCLPRGSELREHSRSLPAPGPNEPTHG